MYAIIETGGKQYRVSPGDVLDIERIAADDDNAVEFDQVLAIADDGDLSVGTPTLAGARVKGELIEQRRGKKVIVYRMKRRKGSRRRQGHRQDLSRVRITDISRGGGETAQGA